MTESICPPTDRPPILIRESVWWFAQQMELKLLDNEHKGHWSRDSLLGLLQRLHEELCELLAAIRRENLENVIGEAADVANFAMIIADNARHLNQVGTANELSST